MYSIAEFYNFLLFPGRNILNKFEILAGAQYNVS